jgi:hypothetical protein
MTTSAESKRTANQGLEGSAEQRRCSVPTALRAAALPQPRRWAHMNNQIITVVLAILSLCVQGCTTFIATASYPSAPSSEPDTYHTLLLTYKFNNKTYQISHNWHCSYKSVWAANNGWTVRSTSSSNYFSRALDESTYLYISVAPCAEEGQYMPAIVEVRNLAEKPEIKLVSPGFYHACTTGGNASNVIESRIIRTNEPREDSVLTDRELSVVNEVQKYEYEALPVYVFSEQQWRLYPGLAVNLLTLNKITTPREYNAQFLHDDHFNNQFPYLPLKSNEVVFATPTERHWEIVEGQKAVRILARKKDSNEKIKRNVHFKATVLNDWNAIYDPATKSIYRWGFTQRCF